MKFSGSSDKKSCFKLKELRDSIEEAAFELSLERWKEFSHIVIGNWQEYNYWAAVQGRSWRQDVG